MSPDSTATSSTAVRVQLSAQQVAMIWRGVDYIMGAQVITGFVGDPETASTRGDEFFCRCNCGKHFRWMQSGAQRLRRAGR